MICGETLFMLNSSSSCTAKRVAERLTTGLSSSFSASTLCFEYCQSSSSLIEARAPREILIEESFDVRLCVDTGATDCALGTAAAASAMYVKASASRSKTVIADLPAFPFLQLPFARIHGC